MPNPRTKAKSPRDQRAAVATADGSAQPEAAVADRTAVTPPLSAPIAPLTHEQRRRLRHKLMRKYHR